jgi:ribosomal-protein-alanine N-acetyltransferase
MDTTYDKDNAQHPAMMKPRIRSATLSDLTSLVEIDRMCFTEDLAFDEEEFRRHLSDSNAVSLVADISGTAAGFSIATLEHSGREATLVTLDVLPPYRRSGVGSALVEAARHWLLGRGAGRLFLQVDTSNEAALAFYLGLGFRKVRILSGYYGRGKDAYLMRKNL